jgi:hypothetical protein
MRVNEERGAFMVRDVNVRFSVAEIFIAIGVANHFLHL